VQIYRPSAEVEALREPDLRESALAARRHSRNAKVRIEQESNQQPDWVRPTEWQVMNEFDPLGDHTAYFNNDEEVLSRLVAEIDSLKYRSSKYWPGRERMKTITDRRRARLGWLALGRLIWSVVQLGIDVAAVVLFLRLIWHQFNQLAVWFPWVESLSRVLGRWSGVSWLISQMLGLPGIALVSQIQLPWSWVGQVLAIILALIGATLIWWAPYNLVAHGLWEGWDQRERSKAIAEIAKRAREIAALNESVPVM
jgi:hypothetical protein